jgi:hypothetical protein
MRRRILGALLVVVATGWLLAGVAASTFARPGAQAYHASLAGASWIEAAGGPRHAYFLLPLDLAATPDLATLWIEADQQYQVYADGEDVASSRPPATSGLPPIADPVDLSWRLRKGRNDIGVEIVNGDRGPAAFRAKLTMDSGGNQVNYVTSPATWLAASGVRQVRFPGGNTKDASFSSVSFDASQWPDAAPAAGAHAQALALMPPTVVAGPLTGKVISAGASLDMLASDVIQVPSGVRDAWLRVIAADAYTLSADGHVVASQPTAYFPAGPEPRPRSHAVGIYDIGRYLRAGPDLLLVHVYGNQPAAVYLDGVVDTVTGPVRVATGPGWHAAASALVAVGSASQPPEGPAVVLGSVGHVWPAGLRRAGTVPGLVEAPGAGSLDYVLTGMALVLGLWLGAGLATSRVARCPLGSALLLDAVGHLPALAAAGAVAAVARLPNRVPPWPYIPAVCWLLVAILAACKLSAFYGPAAMARGWPGWPARVFSRLASRFTWAHGGVILIAMASTGQLAYGLGYEPYSGDETVSLLAAQSIRARLLPRLPSGLLYLKGELYEYPLALYTAIFGEGQAAVRLLTIVTYGATVLAFGLLLLPLVLRGRHRLAQLTLTLLFATAPMELIEAQLVRMYQQEQFFAVLFVSFFLLAVRASRAAAGLEQEPPAPGGRLWALGTRWAIPLSAVTLVAMYLSLEESFILLPAIPLVLVGGLGLRWLRDRHWLRWGLPAAAIIGIQYWLTIVTKMPVLGYDRSNKPYIYYDPSQFYYYLEHYLLAIPGGSGGVPARSGNGSLYQVTSQAVVAGAVGVVRRDFSRIYLSAFCWLPVMVLSTVFSAYAERYIFILLPVLFALAGLGALDILGWLRALLPPGEVRQRRLGAGLILAATVPGFIWLAGSIPARLQDYGLAVSRLAGVPYARQQPDYSTVAAYMRARGQPGDLFITLASTTSAAFYAGRAPDMVIQPHPSKLLYLTEKNGIVIDVYYGRPVILTAADLEQVIASHRRIWLMTDHGPYFDSVPADMTRLIRAQFTEVAGDTRTVLYFKGSLCVSFGWPRPP